LLRKLTRREAAALALLAGAVLGAAWWWRGRREAVPALAARTADAPPAPVPRIDLARLDAPRADTPAGNRDIFAYGGAAPLPSSGRMPMVAATPPPAQTPGGGLQGGVPGGDPSAAGGPQLNVKYIGTVDNGRGVKVAVLLTDRDEVLTGQAGQVIANRYRIARINIESVDLEDVGTGQSRRIPLRGSGS